MVSAPVRSPTATAKQSSAPTGRSTMLQRECACVGKPRVTGECEECRKKRLLSVQRYPVVDTPRNRWELEADRVANAVTAGSHAQRSPKGARRTITPVSAAALQREGIPAASAPVGMQSTGRDHTTASLPGSGQPLDASSRRYFEPRFGRDFSSVRIHNGGRAAELAAAVGARAYTTGPHIVFGKGEFAPNTLAGRRLIAHELTHTVQQESNSARPGVVVQRAPKEKCGTHFLFEFDGEINEKPRVRGVPRVYYTQYPTKAEPAGKQVEPLVEKAKLPAGQRSPDGFWRAVCHQPSGAPPQILWVLADYVSTYEPPKEEKKKRASREEAQRMRQARERQQLQKAAGERHREASERVEDTVLGWGLLLREARRITPTDPARAEALVQFVWTRIDSITDDFHREKKFRGLDGLTRSRLDMLTTIVRSGIKTLLRYFKEGSPPHEGIWKANLYLTPMAQQLLSFLNGETSAHDTPLIVDLQNVHSLTYKTWAAVGAAILLGPIGIRLAISAAGRLWILSYANPVLATELATFAGGAVIQIVATGEIPMSPMELVELYVIVRGARGTQGRPQRIRGKVKGRSGKKIDIEIEGGPEAGRRVRVLRGPAPKSMVGAAPAGFAPESGYVSVSVPKAVPHTRNVIMRPDPRLLELARDERINNAGVTPEAFDSINVAVAKVRIDGKVEYLSAGNLPRRETAVREGIHSEEYLLAQVRAVGRGRKVVVEQIYSERIPCSDKCMKLLEHHFPEAQIFFSVRVSEPGLTRGAQLMGAYDVEPLD